jgi:hypothetical protein
MSHISNIFKFFFLCDFLQFLGGPRKEKGSWKILRLYLLYISCTSTYIQPSFKSTIEFVELNVSSINSKSDLKMTCTKDV